MIGALVGYDRLPDGAELIERKATSRGRIELWAGDTQPGYERRYWIVAYKSDVLLGIGASNENNCRKAYDATK